jgi:O-acetylserine/cysteine efflux transporter
VPPLVVLSLLFEGVPVISTAIAHMTLGTWGAVLWQSVANSLFGYAIWGWLLARYPAATIAPLSLLVPVFGMGAAFVYLGEPLPVWKLIAAALIMGGLALNLLWPKVVGILRMQRP